MTAPADPFRDAVREQIKARIALIGPSKSGKTLAALGIARGLVGADGRIALVDTENESSKLYADLTPFRMAKLAEPYAPERYAKIIEAVAGWGYDALVIDSVTPAWSGKGGVMDIVDQAKRRSNTTGWDQGNREYQKLVNAVLNCPVHIICTIRAKQKFDYQRGDDGKMQVTKLGVGPEMRDQFDYEFTITGNLSSDHVLALDARGDLRGETIPAADDHRQAFAAYADLGERIVTWLGSGAERAAPAPEVPAATPTPTPQAEAPERPAQPAQTDGPALTPIEDETQGAAADPTGGLLDDQSEPPNGKLPNEKVTEIAAKVAECAALAPDITPDWTARMAAQVKALGADSVEDLTADNAQLLLERLEVARLQLRERAGSAA